MTVVEYKDYKIEHLTEKDWIISKDGKYCRNSTWLNGDNTFPDNAHTLKEAKNRIDIPLDVEIYIAHIHFHGYEITKTKLGNLPFICQEICKNNKKLPSNFGSANYFYSETKKEAEDFLADDLECRIAQKESHIREYEKEIKELKETLSKFKKD